MFKITYILIMSTLALGLGLSKEKPMKTNKEILKKPERVPIITVYDNYLTQANFKTGWGFSCLIKMPDKNILFDTGADSPTLLFNIEKMNIVSEEIDIIVLSHIHGDHIGGLQGF